MSYVGRANQSSTSSFFGVPVNLCINKRTRTYAPLFSLCLEIAQGVASDSRWIELGNQISISTRSAHSTSSRELRALRFPGRLAEGGNLA
eukprot:scaffold4414_cov135-Isochrysis_galbana.AAC.7